LNQDWRRPNTLWRLLSSPRWTDRNPCQVKSMTKLDPQAPSSLAPSQRRLQRQPDFTGGRLNTFSQVFLRHGLPGAIFGLLCLAYPPMWDLLLKSLTGFLSRPDLYVSAAVAILIGLNLYAWYIDRGWQADKLGWIIYLGLLSAWEEWVFRLAIPYTLNGAGVDLRVAVIGCNLAFGLMHYFTLRWKWQWCVAAFLGGMAFSRQFHEHFDLLWIIAIHWVATFINTPRLPGQSASKVLTEQPSAS